MEKVNLAEKFSRFTEQWSPKVVGELNGQHVKLAKFDGAYDWHSHEREDEMFLVLEGQVDIELRDRRVSLEVGEFFIVPRGVEHRPVATAGASVMMFEPATTRNTGDVVSERTIEPDDLEHL